MTAAIFALAGCGGGDDNESEPAPAPAPAPTESASGAAPSANACRTAMITALTRANIESQKFPEGDQRALAFEKATGPLPSECRLLERETLQKLLADAREVAIPQG